MPARRRPVAAACVGACVSLALLVLNGMTVRYDAYQGRFEPYFLIRQWLYQRYYKNHELFLGAQPAESACQSQRPLMQATELSVHSGSSAVAHCIGTPLGLWHGHQLVVFNHRRP